MCVKCKIVEEYQGNLIKVLTAMVENSTQEQNDVGLRSDGSENLRGKDDAEELPSV